MDNSRAMRRIRGYHEARYRLKGDMHWLKCIIDDINVIGLSMEGKSSFFKDDIIEIQLILGTRVLDLIVKVRHTFGKRAGGNFQDISETIKKHIQDYMDHTL